MAELIEFPGKAEVTTEALTWPERARASVVTDVESYSRTAELLKGIKSLRTKVAETFDPHIKRAFDGHRALIGEKSTAEAPLIEAERIIKSALVTYDQAQERIRQAEERRLQEDARRAEEDRRLAEAAAMEQEGNDYGDAGLVAEAHALINEPIAPMPIAPVMKAVPKVTGIVHRETWSARVVDLKQLIQYVAQHPEHLNLLAANQTALNGLARSLKAGMKIPGVQAFPTRDVAAGAR